MYIYIYILIARRLRPPKVKKRAAVVTAEKDRLAKELQTSKIILLMMIIMMIMITIMITIFIVILSLLVIIIVIHVILTIC